MRLTLRTLLAYLDDILEPEDREDIGAKVRESEFATALVHRISDVTRRLRLGAPQVVGTGMGRDPNSVAEYLDNTLAAEQVQLFEKVCLESDVHLAEVGSCHHILTMILGEPAQVDAQSRERMYRLLEATIERPADQSATAAETAAGSGRDAVSSPAAMAAAGAGGPLEDDEQMFGPRRKPAVPEYLRQSSSRRLQTIVLTVAGGALATAIILAMLDPQKRIYRALGWNTPQEQRTVTDDKPVVTHDIVPRPAPPAPPVNPPASGGPDVASHAAPDSAVAGHPAGVTAPPVPAPTGKERPGPSIPTPRPGGPRYHGEQPVSPPTQVESRPGPVGPPSVTPAAGGATPGTPVGSAGPLPPVAAGVAPAAGAGAAKAPDQVATVDTKPTIPGGVVAPSGTQGTAAPPPPATPVAVGRLISGGQVLLRSAAKAEPWERLPAKASLSTGDRLLALPCFRPKIGISGLTIEMDGATQIDLGPADASGVPQVSLGFGRLIVRTIGQPNARLHIHVGEADGILGFGDAESKLALEVQPRRTAGTDPEKVPSQYQVTLLAASGRITWTVRDKTTTLQGPRRLTIGGVPAAGEENNSALPGWIAALGISPLEQRGAVQIEHSLTPDHSVKLSLIEQAAHQRVEVRNLATRCCAYIGHFEPLVKGLSDEDQRAGWMTYAAELHDAVTRDPETAAAARTTFEKFRQDKAADLYRMLWGYSAAGLASGDARRLVQYLDHDDLDFRVLAFWNLQEITGLGLNYRPEYTEAKRKQSIIRWQKRLEERKIVPAGVPAAAPSPAAPAAPPKPPTGVKSPALPG